MLVKGETGTEELLCFQKVIFCLALYTEEANLQTFVMIECKTVCRHYLRSENFILVNVFLLFFFCRFFFFFFFFFCRFFFFNQIFLLFPIVKMNVNYTKKVCREYNLEVHFQ